MYSRDVTELTNEFNEFFTSVGAKAAAESKRLASVNALPEYKAPSANTIFHLEEFQFRAVTTFEVRKIIVSFPSNRAPGMDKLRMSVIKDALPVILPVLTELMNRSLLTSVFPSAWEGRDRDGEKTAHVSRFTKIVDCIRIVLDLSYTYKPKPFSQRKVCCVTVFAIQIGSHVAEPDTFT